MTGKNRTDTVLADASELLHYYFVERDEEEHVDYDTLYTTSEKKGAHENA